MPKKTKKMKPKESGAIALITVVVVGFVTLLLALSISLAGFGELKMGFQEGKSAQVYYVAEACMEEAGLRLKRDSNYSGGSLTVGDKSCTIVISANGGERTVTATAGFDNFVRKIEMVVSIVPRGLNVTSWKELTN